MISFFLFSSLQMIQNSDHWERLIIWTPKLEREKETKSSPVSFAILARHSGLLFLPIR